MRKYSVLLIVLLLVLPATAMAKFVGDMDSFKVGRNLLAINMPDGQKKVIYPYNGDLKIIHTIGFACINGHYHPKQISYIKDGTLRVYRGSGLDGVYTEVTDLSPDEVMKLITEITSFINNLSMGNPSEPDVASTDPTDEKWRGKVNNDFNRFKKSAMITDLKKFLDVLGNIKNKRIILMLPNLSK